MAISGNVGSQFFLDPLDVQPPSQNTTYYDVIFILASLLQGFQMFGTPLTAEKFLSYCQVLKTKRGENVSQRSKTSLCCHLCFQFSSGITGTLNAEFVRRFLQRHRLSIRERSAKSSTQERKFSEANAEAFIRYCQSGIDRGLLKNPKIFYNLDETGCKLGKKKGRVIVQTGTKEVASYSKGEGQSHTTLPRCCTPNISVIAGDERKQITVLCCGNAEGDLLRPFVLYDGKKALVDWVDRTGSQIVVWNNKSGIMNTKLFYKYIIEEVIPHAESQNLPISEKKASSQSISSQTRLQSILF